MRTLTRPGTYRPPRGGEPSRLREDGHWSTQGLVGYWPMREGRGSVVQDVSGFGNHGTMTNMDPATDWVAGPDGAALDFDGIDDRLVMDGDGSLAVTDEFTIAFAMNAIFLTTFGALVNKRNNNIGYELASDGRSGRRDSLSWRARTADFANTWPDFFAGYWGKWVTVAVVGRWSGAVTDLLAYRDGALFGAATSAQILADATPLWVAYRPSLSRKCAMHSLAIYSRALSADEIAALYAAPYLPLWRPRMGISLAMLTPAAGLPLITSRTLGRIGPSLRGLR